MVTLLTELLGIFPHLNKKEFIKKKKKLHGLFEGQSKTGWGKNARSVEEFLQYKATEKFVYINTHPGTCIILA